MLYVCLIKWNKVPTILMWSCFADLQPSAIFQYFIMKCWALLFMSVRAKQPWPSPGASLTTWEPEHRQHFLSRRWFLFPYPPIILGVGVVLAVPHTWGTRIQNGLLKCRHFHLPVPFGEELSVRVFGKGWVFATDKEMVISFLLAVNM